ncbi:hypothetical protein C2845_PM15G16450 [Panicum miliaceum]|uniref:Uncharacterized protein n=1 Tax=Panicum miliaceum TaxID=4540 RepID=A0A3L6QA29_PANMI|nr:hypothetical protein C2845_PM15G16450 [Panicum miliaceum]
MLPELATSELAGVLFLPPTLAGLEEKGFGEAGRPDGGDGKRAALEFWRRGRRSGQVRVGAPMAGAVRGGEGADGRRWWKPAMGMYNTLSALIRRTPSLSLSSTPDCKLFANLDAASASSGHDCRGDRRGMWNFRVREMYNYSVGHGTNELTETKPRRQQANEIPSYLKHWTHRDPIYPKQKQIASILFEIARQLCCCPGCPNEKRREASTEPLARSTRTYTSTQTATPPG